MANPRQDRPFESTTEQTGKVTEEATRVTRNVADFSERAARTNIDMLQSGMETARHIWESGSELTSALGRRTTDEFGRALGLAGRETDETAQRASRNVAAIAQTSHALNEGIQKISGKQTDADPQFQNKQFPFQGPGRVGIFQRSIDPGQAGLVGHHGSLTPEEQLVPLIAVSR